MKESSRTATFVGVAAALSALAGWTWSANRPPDPAAWSDEGKELFAALEETRLAPEAMEVSALDDKGQPRDFIVRRKDGLWTIPSHYNYPAEAVERLARTATALIGLKRQGLVSRLAADHEKYGVVDPRNPGSADPSAVGKRITIKGAGDEILADLIVGSRVERPVEETNRPRTGRPPVDLFHVRVADEDSVYRIPLELDLSTRFTDWIQPDLIDLSDSTARRVKTDRYQIEEQKNALGLTVAMTKMQGDQLLLSRPGGASPWELDGLDKETERLKSFEVDDLVRTIDGLQIRGVRPKFLYRGQQLITAELQLNPDPSLRDDPERLQRALVRLQGELAACGFTVIPRDEQASELSVYAEFGEIELGSDQGVVYTLYFGREVEGDEQSIEIGTPARDLSEENEAGEPPPADAGSPAEAAPASGDGPKGDVPAGDDTASKKNRYLLVRVWLDESLLPPPPEAPVEPVAPVPPEGYQPPAETPPAGSSPSDNPENRAGDESAPAGGEPGAEPPPARDPAWVEYDLRKGEYDSEKMRYELARTRYEEDLKAREEKLKAARDRVRELNERFGQWYYVVSSSNLEKLRPKRSDLVEAIKPATPPADQELPPVPDISFGND